MFGNNIDKIKLDSLLTQVNDLNRQVGDWWRKFNEMKELISRLYKVDKHGSTRPRVDILDDDIYRSLRTLEENVYGLQEKVELLEKVK